ncbi:MAG: hypothetical protein JW896_08110, partial [Deltaproteobacteria bacterium]|nr:hypothetical protein [Deltaproteobacteria bacterium]
MGKNNPQTLNQKRWFYVILPLFIGSVIAYLDRVNIAYAALTMNQELGFSASIYSMGAGIFCRLRPLRNSGRGRHDQLLRKYRGLCEIVFRRMDQSVDRFLSSAFAGNPAFMRGGML